MFFRISNLFGLNITEDTLLVETRIWCIKIGIELVLHTHLVAFLRQAKKINK
jgi:hypothetical protein